jgi:hypothetical protein
MQPVQNQPTFRRKVSSESKNKPRKKQVLFATYFMLVSCLVYSSNLKMETSYFEPSANIHLTTRWHLPADRTFLRHIGYNNIKIRLKNRDLVRPGCNSGPSCCDNGNELSGSIISRNFWTK